MPCQWLRKVRSYPGSLLVPLVLRVSLGGGQWLQQHITQGAGVHRVWVVSGPLIKFKKVKTLYHRKLLHLVDSPHQTNLCSFNLTTIIWAGFLQTVTFLRREIWSWTSSSSASWRSCNSLAESVDSSITGPWSSSPNPLRRSRFLRLPPKEKQKTSNHYCKNKDPLQTC